MTGRGLAALLRRRAAGDDEEIVVQMLAAAHDAVNRFWSLDATGLAVAGLLLLAAVWPRRIALPVPTSPRCSSSSASS
jgi:hypothetical protein